MNSSKAGLESGVRQLRERLAALGPDGERLLQAHAHLASLLDQRRMCVWTTDAALRLTSTAGAVEAVLGFAIDPAAHTSLPDLLGETDPIVEATRCALADRELKRTVHCGGRIHSVFISPLRDPAQAIIGAFASAVDITDTEASRQLLSDREQRFRDFVENANDLI